MTRLRCSRCRRTKPVAAFHRNKASRTGRKNWCKLCVRQVQAARPHDHPERVKMRARWHEKAADPAFRQRFNAQSRDRHHRRKGDPKYIRRRRGYKLKTKYGITLARFEEILASQGGRCAICKTAQWTKTGPSLDHNHRTGQVRGVLCNRCNAAIGFFDENPERMRCAQIYLSTHAINPSAP